MPPDLDQNFSAVRQALGDLLAERGPVRLLPELLDRDAQSRPSRPFTSKTRREISIAFYARLIPQAPAIKQAEAKLLQARRDLDQAELNLRYCDIVSEIDGVVTGRNVNPGNNVQVGQSLMAVRSLTEIWIDANFKETQLANLRIGQRVRCEVDMYGSRREFEGRITGLHHGDRRDPVAAAAAERHGQLREDRPAPAGPDRIDRLRPRQGSACSSACRSRPTCITRSRPPGRTPGVSCSRLTPVGATFYAAAGDRSETCCLPRTR